MSLLDEAAADLASILDDTVGGFSIPIVVIDPAGNQATINGLANDIGMTTDPQTGMAIAGRQSTVALSLAALEAEGLGVPVNVTDKTSKPWLVRFTLPNGCEATFKVSSTMPDQLGVVVCFLEAYNL